MPAAKEKKTASSQQPAKKGIFRDVIDSIFEPGVNRGVLVVMNSAFAGLFLILAYLAFATNFNIHVCALSVIAILLFVSIQWFIIELAKSKATSGPKGSASSKPKTAKQIKTNKKKKL